MLFDKIILTNYFNAETKHNVVAIQILFSDERIHLHNIQGNKLISNTERYFLNKQKSFRSNLLKFLSEFYQFSI